MTAIADKLDQRLQMWDSETAAAVERLVNEIISLADQDALGLLRSRHVEQEVLNILDEPQAR
jgi:hypothetical protein